MKINNEILIIDDEVDICKQISGLLNDKGFSTKFKFTAEDALETFRKNEYSLVLLDIWLNNSKFDGFQTLEKIKNINIDIPVIMISGHGNIETAVNSIKKGAYDFIEKPFDSDLLIFKVKKALENYELKKKLINLNPNEDSRFVSNSIASKNVINSLKKIIKTDSSVLFSGQSGSGREFLSRKIHNESNRKNRNLRVFHFNNIIDKDIEISLFGKEQNQIIELTGIFEEVDGGSIILRDIECIPKKVQGKLLRILEEKKFYRIGGLSPISVNFRIIATSKHSLEKLKKKNILRNDLLKKINFFEIAVPSLINRTEDINDLVRIFLDEASSNFSLERKNISNEVIDFFSELECFNNILQLKKFIEWSLFMLCDNNEKLITKENLSNLIKSFLGDKKEFSNNDLIMNLKLKEARDDFEKNYLIFNLEKYNNNISKMSENIGMERTALYRKLKLMKIKVD